MNSDIFEKVRQFRIKLELPISNRPHLLEPIDISFYARFLMEELSELMKAHEKNNLVDAVDAIADLTYVAMGCAHHMGFDLPKILDIVHNANMKKEAGITSRGYSQDAIKPVNWIGPEDAIALELLNQCR